MKFMFGFVLACTRFFLISNRLKLVKNQTYAKQYPQAEYLLFENYSNSSFKLSSKKNRTYFLKKLKNKCVCIHEIIRLIKMKITQIRHK